MTFYLLSSYQHLFKKRQSLLWPGASHWRICYHRMWCQLSNTCSNVLNQPNGELLVAVNQNQLRTITSETVDQIEWSHPPPSWAVPPERHVHSINECNLSGTRTCSRSMQGNHLAYAATPGICCHSGYMRSLRVYAATQGICGHSGYVWPLRVCAANQGICGHSGYMRPLRVYAATQCLFDL